MLPLKQAVSKVIYIQLLRASHIALLKVHTFHRYLLSVGKTVFTVNQLSHSFGEDCHRLPITKFGQIYSMYIVGFNFV